MTSPLTLDDVIIALVDNKVFLLVKPKPAFEQGSPSAKTTVTPPAKCMPASILNKPKPVAKAKASTKSKEPVAPAPVPSPQVQAQSPVTEQVAVVAPIASNQVKEPEMVPTAETIEPEPVLTVSTEPVPTASTEPVQTASTVSGNPHSNPQVNPPRGGYGGAPPLQGGDIPHLKELKKMKVAAIRDLATRLGISLTVTEDGKTKQKIKDVLIADIMAMV